MKSKVITRYSQALFKTAADAKLLKVIASDAEGIIKLAKSDRAFILFLQSPVIKIAKKKKIIIDLFSGRVDKLTLNFMTMLVSKGREYLLMDILLDFLDKKDQHDGIIRPVFTVTYSISEDEKKKVKSVLDKYTGRKCLPVYEINENLIGGSTIQIKDTVIDGSIKRNLELLREKFKTKL